MIGKVLGGVAAALVLLLVGREKDASAAPGAVSTPGAAGGAPHPATGPATGAPATSTLPAVTSIQDEVAKAVASGNAATMRAVAASLRARGYVDAAKDLEDLASHIDSGGGLIPTAPAATSAPTIADIPQTGGGGITPAPAPSGGIPSAPAPAPAPVDIVLPGMTIDVPEDPQRRLAQDITTTLRNAGGLAARPTVGYSKEFKAKVGLFQKGEGSTPDGWYGPGTAQTILTKYGIVPVAPFFWSKTGATTQKAKFIAAVKAYANSDPARSAQYDALIRDTQRS